jgi:hypothetical protein
MQAHADVGCVYAQDLSYPRRREPTLVGRAQARLVCAYKVRVLLWHWVVAAWIQGMASGDASDS